MAKKIQRSFKLRQDQIDFLDDLAHKAGEGIRSIYVRQAIDEKRERDGHKKRRPKRSKS